MNTTLAPSNSQKRKAFEQDSYQGQPIVIDDLELPKERISQRPPNKKIRRAQKSAQTSQKTSPTMTTAARVVELLKSSQNIVVISGAGISANAGVPTFQKMKKSRGTSFDRTVYYHKEAQAKYMSTVSSMLNDLHLGVLKPTLFHKSLEKLARGGQMLQHYTQNIDCIEQLLPDLEAKTTRLHGQVDQMRCSTCSTVFKVQARSFDAKFVQDCSRCVESSQLQVSKGRRPPRVGKLWPNIALKDDPHPDDTKVCQAYNNDRMILPDLVLVVGTRLTAEGTRSFVRDYHQATRSNSGLMVWVNTQKPTANIQRFFDHMLQSDCDALTWSSSASLEIPEVSEDCWATTFTSAPVSIVKYALPQTPAQQLCSYDDILTDMLIDGIYYEGIVRKFSDIYTSVNKEQERVISILRDVVIKDKNLSKAEGLLLLLPCIKSFYDNLNSAIEKTGFREHMRKYLNIYLPDCAFEISGTNRYTITTHEAKIIARKSIRRGEEIRYLKGSRAILTAMEDNDKKGQSLSVIKTSRNDATSALGGPVVRANHDCKPNARFITIGTSKISIIATNDIEIGTEITVSYDKHFFGTENCYCLCKTCENWSRNGWEKKDQVDNTMQIEHRYPSRQEKIKPKGIVGTSTPSRSQSGSHLPVDRRTYRTKSSHRVSGDYLSFNSKTTWTHSKQCLVDPSLRSNTKQDSCSVCGRHRHLYGYHWPKTAPRGRLDLEERRYFESAK